MAKEEHPIVTDPFVERDSSCRRFSSEIRGDIADMKTHVMGFFVGCAAVMLRRQYGAGERRVN